jgi:DNA-binding transcriptional MerR regulator
MIKIGEAAAKYDISNRTLRYWEEAGILESCRMENGYRYYDELNIKKIRQIKLLRKLRLPIQDIQRIFVSGELSAAVEVLTNHMEETKHEAEELKALGVVLERLIEILRNKQNLAGIFEYLEVHDNSAAREFKNALQITLSGRKNVMLENSAYNQTGEVRIINLPRMIIASYCVVSETPENDCTKVMDKLIREYSLYNKPGFRHFGFNNPNPEAGRAEYGYEMWSVVPEDFVVPKPFVRKDFTGGLYAAIPTYLPSIGERWRQLYEWVQNNESYEVDWNRDILRNELEECIDYITFNSKGTSEANKQLDLLMPIKRVIKPSKEEEICSK